jgi:hypothetical protein
MPHDEAWYQLPLVDRLELVAFDLELRRAPRALIAAVWEGRDALAASTLSGRIDTHCTAS